MSIDLESLIAHGECEWIDFKQVHHENTADLVHDVLALANSYHKGDRYLIYGVADDRSIVGVEGATTRRRSNDILDILKGARFNHLPVVQVVTRTLQSHEVDILEIKDMREKPYFLTLDKQMGQTRVRAGAIYLRVGDTNTPGDKTADDIRVERMYRERFGIDLAPLERLPFYLSDVSHWKPDYDESNRHFFRYEPFPEFTMIEGHHSESEDKEYMEPWVLRFPNTQATKTAYYLKYHGTILKRVYFVSADGGKYVTALPKILTFEKQGELIQFFYSVADSLTKKANDMYQNVYPQPSASYLPGGFPLFESHESAKVAAETEYDEKSQDWHFYRYDKGKNRYVRISRGIENTLVLPPKN